MRSINTADSGIDTLSGKLSGTLSRSHAVRAAYAGDASIYEEKPEIVVWPKDKSDLVLCLEYCRRHDMSILFRGAATSLAGQTVQNGLVLDMSVHFDGILEFNQDERWIRVQPGIVLQKLNAFLKPYQLHFAPDPATASRATIGGMISNNSSGTKSLKYGKTSDHVLELQILLADGSEMHCHTISAEERKKLEKGDTLESEIIAFLQDCVENHWQYIEEKFPGVMRRVSGYALDAFQPGEDWNLAHLLCGSEGSLAAITEAKLHLEPLPAAKAMSVLHFRSLGSAIQSVEAILQSDPVAVELLDSEVLTMSRANPATAALCAQLIGQPVAILIVEFYGESLEELRSQQEDLRSISASFNSMYHQLDLENEEKMDQIWSLRKKGLGLIMGTSSARKPLAFIEDSSIPQEHLAEYIQQVTDFCHSLSVKCATYAHASVGVIHLRPFLDLRIHDDIEKMKKISEFAFSLVMKYGGSWSGEHGDGRVRSHRLEEYFGAEIYDIFRRIKTLFDPEGIMNKGVIVDAVKMDESLRYGLEYSENIPDSTFQFEAEGSFEAALHLCSGVAACRQLEGGMMCPSFQSTQDELQSPRGRANLLRMAYNGRLSSEGIMDPGLEKAMQSCLSCKACKIECPSMVDVARLKSEYMHQKHLVSKPGLRDRMIANSPSIARRVAGPLAYLVNLVNTFYPTRQILNRLFQLDPKTSLPKYSTNVLRPVTSEGSDTGKEKIALFLDTYLTCHEPRIGQMAIEHLESLQFKVIPVGGVCCQRPAISKGFLTEAKKGGSKTLAAIQAYLEEGIQLAVCEPSCLSSLIDDLPDLLPEFEFHKYVHLIKPIEQIIAERVRAGDYELLFNSDVESLYIHNHCHQKALTEYGHFQKLIGASNSSIRIEESAEGCCGMAGSFGYEIENVGLSHQIYHKSIGSKQLDQKATCAASGFSCRHQMERMGQEKVRHPLELFRIEVIGEGRSSPGSTIVPAP